MHYILGTSSPAHQGGCSQDIESRGMHSPDTESCLPRATATGRDPACPAMELLYTLVHVPPESDLPRVCCCHCWSPCHCHGWSPWPTRPTAATSLLMCLRTGSPGAHAATASAHMFHLGTSLTEDPLLPPLVAAPWGSKDKLTRPAATVIHVPHHLGA